MRWWLCDCPPLGRLTSHPAPTHTPPFGSSSDQLCEFFLNGDKGSEDGELLYASFKSLLSSKANRQYFNLYSEEALLEVVTEHMLWHLWEAGFMPIKQLHVGYILIFYSLSLIGHSQSFLKSTDITSIGRQEKREYSSRTYQRCA